MPNVEAMTKSERQDMIRSARCPFEHSSFFSYSSFVLCHSESFAFIRVIRGLIGI